MCGSSESAPVLFAVPIDWRVGFHFDVSANAGLACQPDIFAFVADDLESKEWMEPLPEAFEEAAGRDVFLTLTDDDAAAAALAEAHAVHVFVGTFVDLNTVIASNFAQVFALSDVHGEFFVDKPDLGHKERFPRR